VDVKITVGPSRLRVSPQLHPLVFDSARKALKFRVHGYAFTAAHRNYGWDGYKYPLRKDQTAPAGLYAVLKQILKDLGCAVSVTFDGALDPLGTGEIHGLDPDDFQKKAVKMAVKARHGIIWAQIRSGKTAIIAMLASKIGHFPTWVITSASQGGKEVVTQTQEELARHLKVQVGIFSEGHFTPGDVVVTSYEAIKHGFVLNSDQRNVSDRIIDRNRKVVESVKLAKVLILDECHHAFSAKSQEVIGQFSNIGYKIGLSGTPIPDKLSRTEVQMGIGPIVVKGSFEDLIKKGRLAKPLVIVYNLPYRWYSGWFTEYKDVYWSHVIANEFRNRFIADVAKNLMQRGKRVYIMVRRRDHGPNIRKYLPESVWIHGDIKSATRKTLYAALQKGTLKCIITTVGKEGLNLPELDAVINAEALSGKVVTIQKMRSLTACAGKEHGIVIDFMDKGKYLADHSESRLGLYQKNKGFDVKIKRVPADYFGGVA